MSNEIERDEVGKEKVQHDFHRSLQVGAAGEEELRKNWGLIHPNSKLVAPLDRTHDFQVEEEGGMAPTMAKVEIKTDTYDPNSTANFFMERFSNMGYKTVGGPWRTLEHSVDLFIYHFPKGRIWYEFSNVPALIEKLDELTGLKGLVYVKNTSPSGGYWTGGYIVPREELKDLYTIHSY